MVVVYLVNQYMKIIVGELNQGIPQIQQAYEVEDTLGCIVNGMIIDRDGIEQLLKEAWERFQFPRGPVTLVLESGQIHSRQMEVPCFRKRKILAYIKREFSDVERITDPVVGYFSFDRKEQKKNQMISVCANMASRAYLQEWKSIFECVGVEVGSVESVRGAVLLMLAQMPQFSGATAILQFVEGEYLINVLEYHGKYVYIDHVRLFAESDTRDYVLEAARSVSHILQFAVAQNLTDAIPHIYISGIGQEDMALYKETIAIIAQDSQVQEWETNLEEDYVLAATGFYCKHSKTGLLNQAKQDPVKQLRKQKIARTFGPLMGVTVLAIAVILFLLVERLGYERQLQLLQKENQSTEMLAAVETYNTAYAQWEEMENRLQSMEDAKTRIMEYPVFDRQMNQCVAACAEGLVEAEIRTYDASTGMIEIDVSAEQAGFIYQFVERMMQEEMFCDVTYDGYSQQTENSWSAKIYCLMDGRWEDAIEIETDGER